MKLLFVFGIVCVTKMCFCQQNNEIKIKVFEYNEFEELSDSFDFYSSKNVKLSFAILNEHLYNRILIPDSIRNQDYLSDTVIKQSNLNDKKHETIFSQCYDKAGYLIEEYYSSCLACGRQSYREYYEYNNNRITRMIRDNLGINTRQIYDVFYNTENEMNQIIIYKEYYQKGVNSFSNIFGKPDYKVDLEFKMKKVERNIIINYD